MNERVDKQLRGTTSEALNTVARGVLGNDRANVVGSASFESLTGHHNDARTLAIVKVSGIAADTSGNEKPWSSVVKVIDLKGEAVGVSAWISTESLANEPLIYEHGLMSSLETPLRAAECYLAQDYPDGIKVLWLEDLSDAPQPPWSLEQFTTAANHVGQFNSFYTKDTLDPSIYLARDSYLVRQRQSEPRASAQAFLDSPNSEMINKAFGSVPIESVERFEVLHQQLLEKTIDCPHSVSFGDFHARNAFPFRSETVAIDWANLTFDPTGVDIGVLSGSALSWRQEEALLVTEHERDIFQSYMDGLSSADWAGKESDVRMGFFCHFGGYMSMLPASLMWDFNDESMRKIIENRLGIEVESLPDHFAPTISLIPGYIEEIEQLLN